MCGTEYGFLSHTILYRRDLLTAYDGNPITYDAIGNPTTWYDGAAMTWTNGRRLATISATNDHAALSFTYDSDGLRLTKTVGTEVHKYTWQGSKLIAEQYGDTALEFFYDESGTPYALLVRDTASATPTEAWYYYVTNLQGDVMQILDASGNNVASYTYNAWGKILNLNNSTSANIGDLNPIRYRGYYYDTETGLYYLKSRYYDPEICRFVNADDTSAIGANGDFLGLNLFAYCVNSPVNRIDEGGNISWNKAISGASLVAIGVTACLTAVTVVTGGACLPLLIAATVTFAAGGVTVLNGTAEIIESATDYNYMRDGIYRGDAGFYTAQRDVLATVATIGTAVLNAASAAGNLCFVAGTLVKTENGAKAIEEIQVGDLIWAWDEETGQRALKPVLETYVNETDELIHVTRFICGREISLYWLTASMSSLKRYSTNSWKRRSTFITSMLRDSIRILWPTLVCWYTILAKQLVVLMAAQPIGVGLILN